MEDPVSLVLIAGVAVLAPVCAELTAHLRIPSVLFELLLGILIGPFVLGWADVTPLVDGFSVLGLSFLMLMAGYEVDLPQMKGAPLALAAKSWVASLVLGLAVAGVLVLEGFVLNDLLVGLALTTTALGVLLPMMADRGLLPTERGRLLLGAGTLGEFGPIVAIALLLSGDNPVHEAIVLVVFVVVAVTAALVALRPQPPTVVEVLQRHFHTSAQLPVRITIFLLALMLLLAFELGLDTILGAFTAGVLLRMFRSEEQAEELDTKLEAVGFGFLIPLFFVVTGMNFDVDALFDSVGTIARVPVFLALFLVVRGLPALVVYRSVLAPRVRVGLAIIQSTALPLVVVITTIGLETERMTVQNATALVGAAMLSVLVFPLVGFRFFAGDEVPGEGADTLGSGAAETGSTEPAPGASPAV
jgi:Kef-type K+ transport system membrane component KefB